MITLKETENLEGYIKKIKGINSRYKRNSILSNLFYLSGMSIGIATAILTCHDAELNFTKYESQEKSEIIEFRETAKEVVNHALLTSAGITSGISIIALTTYITSGLKQHQLVNYPREIRNADIEFYNQSYLK